MQQNMANTSPAQTIAELNDAFRKSTSSSKLNQMLITEGISALCGDTTNHVGWMRRGQLFQTIRDFNDFPEGDNPQGERDFGAFTFADVKCYWKIDYYNLTLDGASENPADPSVTRRVLTIMRAEEY